MAAQSRKRVCGLLVIVLSLCILQYDCEREEATTQHIKQNERDTMKKFGVPVVSLNHSGIYNSNSSVQVTQDAKIKYNTNYDRVHPTPHSHFKPFRLRKWKQVIGRKRFDLFRPQRRHYHHFPHFHHHHPHHHNRHYHHRHHEPFFHHPISRVENIHEEIEPIEQTQSIDPVGGIESIEGIERIEDIEPAESIDHIEHMSEIEDEETGDSKSKIPTIQNFTHNHRPHDKNNNHNLLTVGETNLTPNAKSIPEYFNNTRSSVPQKRHHKKHFHRQSNKRQFNPSNDGNINNVQIPLKENENLRLNLTNDRVFVSPDGTAITKHDKNLWMDTAVGAAGILHPAIGATGVKFPATGVTVSRGGVMQPAVGVIHPATGVTDPAEAVKDEAYKSEGAGPDTKFEPKGSKRHGIEDDVTKGVKTMDDPTKGVETENQSQQSTYDVIEINQKQQEISKKKKLPKILKVELGDLKWDKITNGPQEKAPSPKN